MPAKHTPGMTKYILTAQNEGQDFFETTVEVRKEKALRIAQEMADKLHITCLGKAEISVSIQNQRERLRGDPGVVVAAQRLWVPKPWEK